MPRRSRQTLDRKKGGNYVQVAFWVPKELRDAANKAAKKGKTTMTIVVEKALGALVSGATG